MTFRVNRGLTVCRVERMKQGFISASDFARRAGLPERTYLKFEGGYPWRSLSRDQIEKVAALLSVAVEEIANSKGIALLYNQEVTNGETSELKTD